MLAPDELDNDSRRLIDHIYGSFDVAANREDLRLIERAILAPRNKDVDALNAHAVASFPGEEFVYSSADRVADHTQAHMFPPEYLHTINPPGFAPHELRLKVGIPIILLRNVSPALGLANGTRLVIMHLTRSVIQAKILTGSHVGNVVCIPRIIMNTDADDKTIPIRIRRRQFPVRPAFAMTINKSQGQTFKEIAIYLPAPVFAHGQLYVALSRVGDPRKITILITHPPLPNQPPGLAVTLNVVHTEIFQHLNAPLPQQPQPPQHHHQQHQMLDI
jgi:ATP-dependent DNA helicase PIF1